MAEFKYQEPFPIEMIPQCIAFDKDYVKRSNVKDVRF